MIHFQGAKIASDAGFLLLRDTDERFRTLRPTEGELGDAESGVHLGRTQPQWPDRESTT